MPGKTGIPEGLKIERTPSGGFRFELPKPPYIWLVAVVAVPFLLVFIVGGLSFLSGIIFSDHPPPWPMLVFMVIFMLLWAGGPLVALAHVIKLAFGRHALEVGAAHLVTCLRLPPLPESRKKIPLSEVTGVVVDTWRGSKGKAQHYLAIKTRKKKERKIGMGLEREALEWLAARVAALAEAAGSGGEGGKGLLEVFEADRRADKMEVADSDGEVIAAFAERDLAAPPEKSGITILEEDRDKLVLKLDAGGGRGLTCFGTLWTAFVAGFTALALFASGEEGLPASWPVFLFLIPFWAVGIGFLIFGYRQRTLVEHLEVRAGEVFWQAQSGLGSGARKLFGPGLAVSRRVSYEQNYQPVYHLRITCPGGKPVKFAGNVKPQGQAWLMAKVARALGQDLSAPSKLTAASGSELLAMPPQGCGIIVTDDRRGRLGLHLAGRGGRGLIGFSAVWLLFTGGIGAVILFAGGPGEGPPLFVYLIMGLFVIIGLVMLVFGLKNLTLVEDLEISPGEVSWRARSILGRSRRTLTAERLEVKEEESYRQNNQPVYHLQVTAAGQKPIKFAGNIKRAGQAWLLGKVARALEP